MMARPPARYGLMGAVPMGAVLGLALGAAAAVAQEAGGGVTDPDDLSPAELMARYQDRCVGATADSLDGADAAAAFAHGARCDALAEAIQRVDLDDRRAGSADLARPDFYTPGSRAQ